MILLENICDYVSHPLLYTNFVITCFVLKIKIFILNDFFHIKFSTLKTCIDINYRETIKIEIGVKPSLMWKPLYLNLAIATDIFLNCFQNNAMTLVFLYASAFKCFNLYYEIV